MNRFIIVLGAAVLAIIILAVMIFGYGNRLDASSKAFVDTNMPVFFSTLSKDALVKISTVAVQMRLNDNGFDNAILKMKELGRFQTYEGSKGEANIVFNYRKGSIMVSADYQALASYQKGPAEVEVKLIRSSDGWQIDNVWVSLPIFAK